MKKIFSLLMMSVLAVAASWADVYTHTFASGELNATDPTVTLDNISWNQDYEWNTTDNYFGFDTQNGRGLQVGSKKNSCKAFSLATTGIAGTIAEVKVNASTASQATATLEVTVAGTSLGVKNLTTTATDYTFTANVSGEIVIKYSQPETKKALYIKSIEITYTTSGATKQQAGIAFPETAYTATLGEAFTAPALTNPNNLTATYASSAENVATVDAATGEVTLVGAGTTTITATTAETDDFYAGTASYTLTVTAPVVTEVNLDYVETFADGMGNFTIEDKTDPLPNGMTYVWHHSTYNGTGFMKASAYFNKANQAVESWLVSPTINLVNAEGLTPAKVELSFDQAINSYFGEIANEAMVMIEVDGTWTKLDITYPTAPTSGWTEFANCKVDLVQYAGKSVKIAFVYHSTVDHAGGWEVNNFSVTGTGVTGVEENVAEKAVSAVKYYNVAGVESNEPFDGVNIVKTVYTDGTTQTAKILK